MKGLNERSPTLEYSPTFEATEKAIWKNLDFGKHLQNIYFHVKIFLNFFVL